MTIQPRRTPKASRLALVLLAGTISCTEQASGPPLVIQRDSAGIEIIEAMRPLWGESSLWSVDPDPVVDLALSGSGPPHEFYRARSIRQRPDGSLAVADRGSQEVRVFSGTGESGGPSAVPERAPENSATSGGSRTPGTPCWSSTPADA